MSTSPASVSDGSMPNIANPLSTPQVGPAEDPLSEVQASSNPRDGMLSALFPEDVSKAFLRASPESKPQTSLPSSPSPVPALETRSFPVETKPPFIFVPTESFTPRLRSYQPSRSDSTSNRSIATARSRPVTPRRIYGSPAYPKKKQQRKYQERHSQSLDGAGVFYSRNAQRPPMEAWKSCVDDLNDHDAELVQGWKEDVDTLLVFAGLFSAVITAFLVDAYKVLLPRDEDSAPPREITFPRRAAVPINALWFSSLVISLAAASIGILVKQWLRDFLSRSASSPRERARIREYRYRGLINWGVPAIVASLPVLLQLALAFFFIGLLELLWPLNTVVAGLVSCFAILSMVFVIATTVLPSFFPSSPYRSPQALALYLTVQAIARVTVSLITSVLRLVGFNWHPWPIFAGTALFRWRNLRHWMTHVTHGRPNYSWRDREKELVRKNEAFLDRSILSGADALFLDDRFLERVVRPCLGEVETHAAAECLIDIFTHRAHAIVHGQPTWKHADKVDLEMSTLFILATEVLGRMDVTDEAGALKTLGVLDKLCRAAPLEQRRVDVEQLCSQIFEMLGDLLTRSEKVSHASFRLMYDVLYPHAQGSLRSAIVVENLLSFARSARETQQSDAFYAACTMAIECASSLQEDEFRALCIHLERMLEELQWYTSTAPTLPSPSLLVAILNLAENTTDTRIVKPELIRTLNHVVMGAEYGTNALDIEANVVTVRAYDTLRSLCTPPRRPHRELVVVAENLDQLGLELANISNSGEVSGASH